jgi:hypothetical protein
MFSASDRGWGEAFVSVYPDSDKIAAAPGVIFRRVDAIDAWLSEASQTPASMSSRSRVDRAPNRRPHGRT